MTMAKHKIGAERKPPRMSYLTRSPSEPPEVMSLDESETLLGSQYGINSRFISPSVTVVDIGGPITPLLPTPLNIRPPAPGTPAITPSPSSFTEQTTLNSQGKLTN